MCDIFLLLVFHSTILGTVYNLKLEHMVMVDNNMRGGSIDDDDDFLSYYYLLLLIDYHLNLL